MAVENPKSCFTGRTLPSSGGYVVRCSLWRRMAGVVIAPPYCPISFPIPYHVSHSPIKGSGPFVMLVTVESTSHITVCQTGGVEKEMGTLSFFSIFPFLPSMTVQVPSILFFHLCPFTLLFSFYCVVGVSLTFLWPLTPDLSLLFLSPGSVLTPPNGRLPNQGLPSLLARKQRLLVSLLSANLDSSSRPSSCRPLFLLLLLIFCPFSTCHHVLHDVSCFPSLSLFHLSFCKIPTFFKTHLFFQIPERKI